MSFNTPALLELLPVIHRMRDVEHGGVLREFLDVLAQETGILEENLAQLHDDQFIETCADWAVPYIGDLISSRPLHHISGRLGSPRALVANTLRHRRRKGTASGLEGLARDAAGWPAKVVEFFELLSTTQFMNHARLHNAVAPDLRRRRRLEFLDGPFDEIPHSADSRQIQDREGRFNIPNVGVFLWRLQPMPLTASPAVPVDGTRFLFSPLGRNTQLFHRPAALTDTLARIQPLDVPDPLSRWRLHETPGAFYGPGKSLDIPGVPLADIVSADLSDVGSGWAHAAPAGKVAVDPVLGRIAFSTPPPTTPLVSFSTALAADVGGGEYDRRLTPGSALKPVAMGAALNRIQDALNQRLPGEVIEVQDSGRYGETLKIQLGADEHLVLRAANRCRPCVALVGDLEISSTGAESSVELDGLLFLDASLRIKSPGVRVRLVDCSCVPGISLNIDGSPVAPERPSVLVEKGAVTLQLERTITGRIQLHEEAALEAKDSVIDSTRSDAIALAGAGAGSPTTVPRVGGKVSLENCTVVGKVFVRSLPLASNTIFHSTKAPSGDKWLAPVWVRRKQNGCVRFSFVPEGSLTPRRHRCQPELEISRQVEARTQELGRSLTPAERAALQDGVVAVLRPTFSSLRFGDAAYAQLRSRCPREIREGADNESEMGMYNHVLAPQREINLRVRLEEYLRVTLEAGIFYVT